jgi:uncharacterized membrane protein YesL
MQLFWDTLRTRLSGLFRLNLLYMLIWLPAMIVLLVNAGGLWDRMQMQSAVISNSYSEYVATATEKGLEVTISEEEYNALRNSLLVLNDASYEAYLERVGSENEDTLTAEQFQYFRNNTATGLQNDLLKLLLWLIPCIAITGPFTAGLSYVTRNWARDEHAFIWSDFRDAVKANWKIPLVLSTITGILPGALYAGWLTYGNMAAGNPIMVAPQAMVALVGILWALMITYMHPLTVTYDLKLTSVIRNGFLLAVARLPFSIGIRLLHCVPTLIAFVAVWFFGLDPLLGLVILCGYYMLVGFSLSRFITASYTNAVFDRFINSRIEGAKVNQGLRQEDDEAEDEDETEKETEE